jgi:putative tryptophan/tyrosine transport system substrate-binding protein
MMERRTFVAGIAAVMVAPLVGETQQPRKIARIGCLSHGSAPLNPRTRAHWSTFEAQLRALGYMPGENILLEYRWAEGRTERLHGLAAEFVRLKVDVIIAAGTHSPTTRWANGRPSTDSARPDSSL